jgi:predicted Zn-dependent protease with MMP-like domain
MDPPTMKGWMIVAVVVAVVRIAEAAETADPLTIDLQMRNDARVPAQVLETSQDDVTRIFAGVGLAVRWTETAPRFTVQIVPQVLGFDRAASPVMGVALRRANGAMAQVFFRQVQDFARAYDVDLGTMLAYVIAHEIGHLLLPGNAHSPTGVMQADWDKALVREAARGSLTFTEAQAARIRASR